MCRKFRIRHKVFFRDDTTEEGYPILTKVVRPVIQMKVGFFWVDIKPFLYYTKSEAEEACQTMYQQLIQNK